LVWATLRRLWAKPRIERSAGIVTDIKKDNLLAQIRFAYKKPIVLGEYPPKESKPLEYWIDRFIDEEVSQYSLANIVQVFSDRERATKLLLVYLEEQGAIEESGVELQEKEDLQSMLKG
jgi:hypothetical protein